MGKCMQELFYSGVPFRLNAMKICMRWCFAMRINIYTVHLANSHKMVYVKWIIQTEHNFTIREDIAPIMCWMSRCVSIPPFP